MIESISKVDDIREMASKYLDENEVKVIFQKADELFLEMRDSNPNDGIHSDLIYSHIAIYKSLMEFHDDIALSIMEQGESISAKRVAKLYQSAVKKLFGKTQFMRGFAKGVDLGFSEESGFEKEVKKESDIVFDMDVFQCPYVTYCRKYGCDELIHIFCDNDLHVYGNLKGIRFTRNQTLEHGEKCDFLLERI